MTDQELPYERLLRQDPTLRETVEHYSNVIGRWVTLTPLDPVIAEHLAGILAVAAELAREGDRERAIRLRTHRDEIRRLLTETECDEVPKSH